MTSLTWNCFLLSSQQPSCCPGRQLGSSRFPEEPDAPGPMLILSPFPPDSGPHSDHPHTIITDRLHDYLFSIFL